MDPMEAMLNESRTKLRELHRESSSKIARGGRRRKQNEEMTSLEAVDQLLSSVDERLDETVDEQAVVEIEKRERNKRYFPDTKAIDPYDPTTYGYIELGESGDHYLCIIHYSQCSNTRIHIGTIVGAHGVHGMMKLTSITDFSEHRLCQPGKRHIKPPNRRSPREVQLVEGRPLRSEAATIGTDTNPTYLIRLDHINDRDAALKLRGCVLYSLIEEKVDGLLEEDEYLVSDLVGLNVYLEEHEDGDSNSRSFEDLFVGFIRGVVMGSEMCAIPGLGQDLLEVVLPSIHGGQGDEMVLVPFVPQIVSSVDLDGRMVVINPPKGLLDLSYRREEKVRIKGLLPPARV